MKELIFSIAILMVLSPVLPAQTADIPVAYSVTGKVKYAPGPKAKFRKLRGGTDLDPDGMIRIYPGAAVGIYYDEEYAVLKEAGERNVAAIIDDVDAFRESDLAELFGTMIDEAVNPFFQVRSGFAVAGDPPPPPPRKKQKDGHGNKEYKLIRILPTGGKVSGNEVLFRWKPDNPGAKTKKFTFILRSADNELLLEKPVKGYEFELGPADYRLNNGRGYRWQVVSRDDPEVNTPSIYFEYAEPAALSYLQSGLAKTEMYQSADAASRLLLEASVLEQADFLAAAYERYRTAARKYKKNQLAQLLFEAFQWRYDIIE